MDPLPNSPVAPPALAARYERWSWEVAWQLVDVSVTYRLTAPSGEIRFLKLLPPNQHPGLEAEADRMRWAAAYLPVPKVVESGSNDVMTWLVTRALPGLDATRPEWSGDPERLVRAFARGLRTFHETPVEGCPFDFSLAPAVAHARRRFEDGAIDPARDFHDEFSHLSASEALALLERTRPKDEDLVVCHGDWCPPNVLLEDWTVTGFLDLGELGVADRWWDLAVGTWSVTWNFGAEYEGVFLAEYGVDRDERRVGFYRLLYDLVS